MEQTVQYPFIRNTSIMEASDSGIIIVDTKGTIQYCNPAILNYTGYPRSEVEGANIKRLFREVRIFHVMENKTNILNEIGTVKGSVNLVEEPEAFVHIISRYVLYGEGGEVCGGLIEIHFRDKLLTQTKKLYTVSTDLNFFRDETDMLMGKNFDTVIGKSANFIKVKQMAIKAAGNNFPILITGETGVGKEIFANLVHRASKRADKPYLKINCAAIPAELIESELFGYESGAFTGASKGGHKGKFELANHGTIFLDEIGDMPFSMQAKLLRALQNKEIERVGGSKTIPIDVRLISATNKDLPALIEQKLFREDLYYRLNVINLKVPALRERKEDILPLAEYFLQELNETYKTKIVLPPASYESLLRYLWPGNVRELNNVIQNGYALANGNVANLDTFYVKYGEAHHQKYHKQNKTLNELVGKYEKTIIEECCRHCSYNLSIVAAELGIQRSSLYNKIKRYSIDINKH